MMVTDMPKKKASRINYVSVDISKSHDLRIINTTSTFLHGIVCFPSSTLMRVRFPQMVWDRLAVDGD